MPVTPSRRCADCDEYRVGGTNGFLECAFFSSFVLLAAATRLASMMQHDIEPLERPCYRPGSVSFSLRYQCARVQR